MADDDISTDDVLAGVGPRLRALRQQRAITLAGLATTTGISVSTLSRLESGGRRATLELLLPLARAYRVPLDELVGAAPTDDPRVRSQPTTRGDHTIYPLTRQPGGVQAYKIVVAAGPVRRPEPRTHEGYEWLYVLSGRLRVILGEHDLVMSSGEAAEFDTRVPHWFGSVDGRRVEILTLFGPQGERVHLRARPKRRP